MKVLFTDLVFEDKDRIRIDGCDFKFHGPTKDPEELIEIARDADVICMRDQFVNVSKETMDKLQALKLIATRSTGYDHIDVEAASKRGIVVCNVPDYGAHMIAEHGFALLLAVARNIVTAANRYSQERLFNDKGLVGVELFGKTLGILGTGRIGAHVVRIGHGFGMKIMAYDVVENTRLKEDYSVRYLPLPQLLQEADFVTVHLSLNKETRGLICRKTLQLMKTGSILVNMARGSIVITEELVEALREGRLAGAGLDVLEDERERYHDFHGLNVVVTPHIGWYTKEAVSRLLDVTLDNIKAFMEGAPRNRVY